MVYVPLCDRAHGFIEIIDREVSETTDEARFSAGPDPHEEGA